ncbi:hypothetical protein CCM_09156 [Cordyceps militaris CM01]|uniref:Uncharacterized protein n=1 Tax=Cordyceps militaris (strain CM01) TaxID=983644 RepID=G3JTL6_CORMM|nr:uncharacterized protein CCM_09156 [Cordyceps militaris CM01]EGX88020.1 hypothetical protein CCM_09156 [Cordyceps militaris CM01]
MSLARILLASGALARLASAIDLTDPLDGCPPAARSIATHESVFNSTGETSFRLSNQSSSSSADWYLALAFRDERAQNALYGLSPNRQTLGVIVSVPESVPGSAAGAHTGLCVYRLEQQDAAANAQASCAGVLSAACIAALESVPAASDGSCPVPDVSGACGGAKVVGSTTTPLVFNNTLCSTNATIPDSDAIPDGYQSYVTFASGELNRTDDSRTSYTVYNEHIQRPAPILITARFGAGQANATTQAKLFCLAPSKVLQGSRGAVVSTGGAAGTAALAKPVLLVSLLASILAMAL